MTDHNYYNKSFYTAIQNDSRKSAEVIVPIILELISCSRVIDVGCGNGTWLKVFQECGVEEIFGIDGSYAKNSLVISQQEFMAYDLKNRLSIGKKYDLSLSLEVAEHLPANCAESFVDSLTSLSSVVLFSAAIPYQGGENHVNEQWQEYWAEKFHQRNYLVVDYIRPKIWGNPQVAYWYRQNMLLFVDKNYLDKNHLLQEKIKDYVKTDFSLLSIVHPILFLVQIGAVEELDENLNLFRLGIPTWEDISFLKKKSIQRYEPTGQAPADISPQGAGNEPKEIQNQSGTEITCVLKFRRVSQTISWIQKQIRKIKTH
ncbi:methyltransferase domain-containing protein [Egbenema bharatensis]|uniref:methyltransferase domain-containing protein n=1 Tax=Egbenema bharatensis TaxID=3463334 RepID=UPI003A89FAB5